MNPVITFFLTCLLLLCAQGLPLSRSHKCKCSSGYVKNINPKLIQAEPRILHPSVFCPRTEIIITIGENQEKCLNPKSPLGKMILQNRNMQDKRGPESSSTSTTTSMTPRRHNSTLSTHSTLSTTSTTSTSL